MDRRMLPQPEPIRVSLDGPEWCPQWSDDDLPRYHLAATHEFQNLWVFGNYATGCWEFAIFDPHLETPVIQGFGETARDACGWAEREAANRAERLGLGRPSREEFKRRVFEDLAGLEQLAESAPSIFGE